ncbi:MAG TPA: hypothetical protein VL172_08850, partial [Kofleriaceae bacterium]|nr:hypothetical protein [Kofleriaceae bacterium]
MSPFRVVFVAALAAAACSSEGVPDEQLQGLVHPVREEPKALDVEQAARSAAELVRAAGTPHRVVAAALGPHVFRGTSSVDADKPLDTTYRIEQDAAGGLHCLRQNSADYAAEMIFTGGTVYVRPRYGKYHRRAPSTEDEPLTFCDGIFAELGDTLDLVGHGIEVSDEGPVDVAGRR